MNYEQKEFKLKEVNLLAEGIYELIVDAPEIALKAQAGQFVHIRTKGYTLRRPISICKIDREQGTLRLVIEVRGKGTEEICSMKAEDTIDLIAPLGHGFELLDNSKKAIVVGGGIGSAPLLEVAGNYGKNCKAILGFRDSGTVVLEQDYIALGAETIICTDNGTKGFHGFTTQMLDKQLSESTADIIYACGPKPMLKGVAEIAARYKIRCQLSMDERMACGIGACLGCACKTKKPDGSSAYSHACKHGPVFEAEVVDFD